ncbi:FHA domain-containing protein [Streptomyces sp. NPDC016845]|uniref:FHA domain-containing protein n=1 Tax=Streptomyces sp. NPDC016845 TaxID=3364972 RepID=UPI0037B20591
MSTPSGGAHRLTLLGPQPLRGAIVDVSGGPLLVGRADACGLRLDDPCVSGRHAVLKPVEGRVVVEDLRSRNGTRVNGAPVTAARPLHHGDVIEFGTVEARYEQDEAARNASLQTVTAMPSATAPVPRQTEYELYARYLQQIRHERDSLLHDIRATRRRARRLLAGCLVLHLAAFAAALPLARRAAEVVRGTPSRDAGEALRRALVAEVTEGPNPLLLTAGGLGLLVALVLGGAGIVLHLVAAGRRRRLEATVGGLRPPARG